MQLLGDQGPPAQIKCRLSPLRCPCRSATPGHRGEYPEAEKVGVDIPRARALPEDQGGLLGYTDVPHVKRFPLDTDGDNPLRRRSGCPAAGAGGIGRIHMEACSGRRRGFFVLVAGRRSPRVCAISSTEKCCAGMSTSGCQARSEIRRRLPLQVTSSAQPIGAEEGAPRRIICASAPRGSSRCP